MPKIKSKVLHVILFTSLGSLALLSIIWAFSILNLRSTIFRHSDRIGETAALDSQTALLEQARRQLQELAHDKADITNEKLSAIQNQTRMAADMATHIYTYKNNYTPRRIGYLEAREAGTPVPHIRTAPGVSLESIKDEVYRAANVADILRQITVVDIGVIASYIGGESGYFIVVDKEAADVHSTDYDVTTRGWYTGAKQNDGFFWTGVFPDFNGRGASIACAMPFYDLSGGRRVFKGVACSGTTLEEAVKRVIDTTEIGETGYAFLLNEKGHVILSPRAGDVLTDETGGFNSADYLHSAAPDVRALATRMINHEAGIMSLELDGQEVYVAYYPLTAIDWSLGVVIPVEEIISPARRIRTDILSVTTEQVNQINFRTFRNFLFVCAFIIMTAVITVIVSQKLSHNLTAPLISLSEGALTVGSGDLNYRFDIKTGDEIEVLADAFNRMIDDITYITGEKERIGTELTIATKIQASMLPSVFPPFPDRPEFDVYAEMHPAKEVGGDFYDFFLLDKNHLALIIADVSGKGVPAAVFMGFAKTLIKVHAQRGNSLDEVFYLTNNQLCENNKTGMFVTAFMGILEIDSGTFTYVNAGHNPPLIRQGGGGFTWLKTRPDLVLAAMEEVPYKVMETTLAEGDMLFLYTDGITEAMNTERRLFSDRRLLEVINGGGRKNTLRDYTGSLLQAVYDFAGGAEQADDITMMILERKHL